MALAAYKTEGMSIYAAAKYYKVKRMTHSVQVHGKVAADLIVGHHTGLSEDKEDSLVNYIRFMHARIMLFTSKKRTSVKFR